MHELPVTESILEITLRHANSAGASKVTDLYLVIGQLSSIIDESIQFYWDMLAADSMAEGANLHFRRIPAEMTCLICDTKFQPDGQSFECPQCRSIQLKITAGEEFYLEAIDVEK